MADAKLIRRAAVWNKFASLPQALDEAMGAQLNVETTDLVAAIQRACPVSADLEKTPGEIRDSVHKYPTPDRPGSYRIIADARDDQGEFIAPHLEWGHLTRNGKVVRPYPFFFPTYRARKRDMRKRMLAVARRTIKQLVKG